MAQEQKRTHELKIYLNDEELRMLEKLQNRVYENCRYIVKPSFAAIIRMCLLTTSAIEFNNDLKVQ